MVDQMKTVEDGPVDRFRIIYVIFYWLGIGTLLPWNMFITVVAYWDHKFRTLSPLSLPSELLAATAEKVQGGDSLSLLGASNVTVDSGCTGYCPNELQKAWGGYLAVASMVPNVTFLILNGVVGHRFKTQPRLLVSLVFVILSFIFTSIMVKVDTDEWQETFLYVTLASVAFINVNAAIFQGGILGVAGKFPPTYMGAVFSGQAVGGIFASGTNVVVLAMGATAVQSAFFCFVLSVVFLMTALVAYAVATRSEFYQHHLGEKPSSDLETKPEDSKLLQEKEGSPRLPVKVNPGRVMLQILPYAAAVFLTFLVTLGCFPAITLQVVSTLEPDTAWAKTFYVPVACFLLFNIGDYVGRFLAGLIQWPRPGKAGAIVTLLLSLARFAFIPLFLFCNIRPSERNLTYVQFESDIAYILIMSLFGISNGYVGSICMISGPQVVRPEEAQTAASLMVALLGLGLGTGAFLSNYFVLLM